MTKHGVKDIAASVRAHLQQHAKDKERPFQEVLQYYAMERFLYRLGQSPHAKNFVLKGGLMLPVWQAPTSRPTKDIDLLSHLPNQVEVITNVVRDVCHIEVQSDGLTFDADTISGKVITEDADYRGVRVRFKGHLQNARISMQIDTGFGDVIVPSPTLVDYPTILDLPPPRLYGYSRESGVAEKFEAMVKLGQINSRMRDFYDLWLLSGQFDFDGPTLAEAVRATFSHRGTPIDSEPVALTAAFSSDATKQAQWRSFIEKSEINPAPSELAEITERIREFLEPVADALQRHASFKYRWNAPGPWTPLVE